MTKLCTGQFEGAVFTLVKHENGRLSLILPDPADGPVLEPEKFKVAVMRHLLSDMWWTE